MLDCPILLQLTGLWPAALKGFRLRSKESSNTVNTAIGVHHGDSMDEAFELEIHPNFLHLKYPAGSVISAESTFETWAAVARLTEKHDCSKVLIEIDRPQRQMDTMSAFDSGRVLAESAAGLTVAMCFHNYQFDDLTVFFKTVAQNRGVKIEFFGDLDEALEWLDAKVAGKVNNEQ